MTLPTYIPGSNDLRVYIVQSATLNVVRGPGQRSVGFNGGGRDGDYVPDGAPEPAVLRAMTEGVSGLTAQGACDCGVATEDDLATIEARMAEASGGAWAITRSGDGSVEVARRLFDAPMETEMRRAWSLRGAWSLGLELGPEGDAVATPWAWGRDPGDWLETTLAAMGTPAVLKLGSGNGAARVVPRERVRELLERALANPLLGPAQVQMTDTRVRR